MNESLQALGSLAPLRLDSLLRRLVDEHGLTALERGLALRLLLPPGVSGAGAVSDAVLLEGCLRNRLDNALKHTVQGGVIVQLLALPGAEAWRVELCDTGSGIAPGVQARVFDEFFHVGNGSRDRARGLGLGLSIVKRTAALLERWGRDVLQGADSAEARAAWRQRGQPALGGAIVDLRLRGDRTGLDAVAA